MKQATLLGLFPLIVLLAQPATSTDPGGDKIPITTSSEAAKKEFLAGRELADNLKATDAIAHFDKALELDPNFASAELARANVSGTAKEFRLHLDRAIALADKASEGERIAIQAAEAGAVGNAAKTKECLERNVALFPNDERARFALGVFYQGQQDDAKAIETFKATTAIAPSFPPVYNNLGYAYKSVGSYPEAEQAFKKYAELIPNDPNPYDSYAELLMKMGRFDESVTQYQKALALDPHFISARIGTAINALYLGKPDVAISRLGDLYTDARNDGERRQAVFVQAVVYTDQGKLDQAIQQAEREFGIAEKAGDAGAMTADMNFKGNLLLAMGRNDEALAAYAKALHITETSALSPAVKGVTTLFHHANVAAVAIAKGDLATARTESDAFAKGSAGNGNRFQNNLTHELAGRIALAGKQYDQAITELQQSNLQDPYNLYRMALAYQGKGDTGKARDYANKAAHWNGLPALNYALVRSKAAQMAGTT
jgi:tetratricopeptide (TPR) repeat protein